MRMGKASRTKQDGDRRARIAAQREAERRAAQRKRIYLAGGSILVVAIVAVALVLVKLNSGGSPAPASNGPTGAALSSLTTEITTEVSNASSQLGSYFGTVNSSTALTSGGKPEVLFMGANYCPYCATQRWALINALSRFGTFTGLTTTHSSSTDADPNTPTFTFYGSKYTSNYINFTAVEETTNVPNGSGGYTTLQTPPSAEAAVGQDYDPDGYIPFIDFGNKYVQVGNLSPLSPTLLAGKSWAQVGAAMADPTSSLGTAEIANANYETAAICKMTNNLPATACTPTIQGLEANFAS